jgi:DNA-binding response OmpR family regulator
MTKRVYYLDDEASLCSVFKEFVSLLGFEVTTFVNAHEAIEACVEQPPDLMFIDYKLADVTGVEVAELLDSDIPKILVTGELSVRGVEAFQEVLEKPFRLAELKRLIMAHG